MTEHEEIEALAALLDGDTGPDDASPALGGLLTLAATVRDHADVVAPSPEFRTSLREQLVAEAELAPGLLERTRTAWTARTANLRSSARVAVATMTASSMIGTAGMAAAAQEAVPGEFLYGLKGLTEDVRLLLADGDVARARLHLAFARERLEELEGAAHDLTADQVVALLAEMDAHSEAGAEGLLEGVSAGAIDPSEVRDFTRAQRDGLAGVFDTLPLLARPVAQDSIELLRRIEISASGIVPTERGCDCDTAALRGLDPSVPQGTTRPQDDPGQVTAPGDGPAVPEADCDCVELPGGIDLREPTLTRDAEDTPPPADEQVEEEREEPFRPRGELADPRTSNDDDEETGERAGIDAPTGAEQLPLDDATEAVGEATGTDVDVEGPVHRAGEGLESLLD